MNVSHTFLKYFYLLFEIPTDLYNVLWSYPSAFLKLLVPPPPVSPSQFHILFFLLVLLTPWVINMHMGMGQSTEAWAMYYGLVPKG